MANSLITTLRNPFKFKMFLLKRLPAAFIAGLKLAEIDEEHAVVTVKYKYLTQNPFRSLYFACLAMAGELASGVLSMTQVHATGLPVSMLVTHMEADFTKKAIGTIRFTCNDGVAIKKVIEESKATGEGRTIVATSIGIDEAGDQVAVFRITWSYKVKSTKYKV